MQDTKKAIISELQKNILLMQGYKPASLGSANRFGLGSIEAAFPNGVFPTGAIHEFLNMAPEHSAAAGGFIAGLLKALMRQDGICLWIGTMRSIYPPALKNFGIAPDRIVFIDLQREKDVLWVMEEALRCEGLSAVIAEVRELDFAQSRRLQLAVEQSRVTGFVLRNDPLKIKPTACVARWKITPAQSELQDGLPGVGFPRWTVELQKVRNGNPGIWKVEWSEGGFNLVTENNQEAALVKDRQKVG